MEKDFKIIIADTNWWISLVIKNFNNKFADLLLLPKLKFISSNELTGEISATLLKERLQKHFSPDTSRHLCCSFYSPNRI